MEIFNSIAGACAPPPVNVVPSLLILMDTLNLHSIKAEKANAKLRYRRLQKITALFRLMELCMFFFIVSRFTTQLPIAFKISGEYFRGLSVMAVSPRFVFIVGNAIVIILFLKSGQLCPKDGNLLSNSKFDLYEEYVKNCEKNQSVYKETESRGTKKKQRKQITFVSTEVDHPGSAHSDVSHSDNKERKAKLNRIHSENLTALQRGEEEDDAGQKLRRSVTVRYRESVIYGEKLGAVGGYAEDELSSEEFRRTVEAFIARQQRFLREEG